MGAEVKAEVVKSAEATPAPASASTPTESPAGAPKPLLSPSAEAGGVMPGSTAVAAPTESAENIRHDPDFQTVKRALKKRPGGIKKKTGKSESGSVSGEQENSPEEKEALEAWERLSKKTGFNESEKVRRDLLRAVQSDGKKKDGDKTDESDGAPFVDRNALSRLVKHHEQSRGATPTGSNLVSAQSDQPTLGANRGTVPSLGSSTAPTPALALAGASISPPSAEGVAKVNSIGGEAAAAEEPAENNHLALDPEKVRAVLDELKNSSIIARQEEIVSPSFPDINSPERIHLHHKPRSVVENDPIFSYGGPLFRFPDFDSYTPEVISQLIELYRPFMVGNPPDKPVESYEDLTGYSSKWGDAAPSVQAVVIHKLISAMRERGWSDMDIAYGLALVQVESGFNPSAQAGSTSASGLGQFINGTRAMVASQLGIPADPFDVDTNILLTLAHTEDNMARAANAVGTDNMGKYYQYAYGYHHDGPGLGYGGVDIAADRVLPAMKGFITSA